MSRPEILDVKPKHYDFSCLDELDNQQNASSNFSQYTNNTIQQSFENVLLNVTKAIPSEQSIHNTVQSAN